MKKIVVSFLVGLLLGGVVGFAGGIFVFPYLFPPPPVNEVVINKTEKDVVAKAVFIHANQSDPIHYGKGHATLYVDLLHLESDFDVGPGPKYHVYLVPDDNVTVETAVQETMYIDLGRLKAFSGSQNYEIPKGTNLEKYSFVVIWCEQFNVLISPASINFY